MLKKTQDDSSDYQDSIGLSNSSSGSSVSWFKIREFEQ